MRAHFSNTPTGNDDDGGDDGEDHNGDDNWVDLSKIVAGDGRGYCTATAGADDVAGHYVFSSLNDWDQLTTNFWPAGPSFVVVVLGCC